MTTSVTLAMTPICPFMAYVIGAAAGHLTSMCPTHRKDGDILASHRLVTDLRSYMVSSAGYDEKRRLKEAIAKVQKAISEGKSEPPIPIRDPFVHVSDEKVRTVIDGKQPEPQDINIVASRCTGSWSKAGTCLQGCERKREEG